MTGWPARAVSKRQAARAGSTTTKVGRWSPKRESEMPRDRSRDAADAGLHEHMGRRLGKLAQGLAHHGGVALHHQPGNALVARPGRVGDDSPALLGRDACGLGDRVVIGALDPDHLGAEAGDGRHALVADAGVHEDGSLGADELRALRDRASVIAVGGTGDRHPGRDGANLGRVQFGDVDRASELAAGFLQHEPDDRVGAAQRLEAAEPEPEALVLDMDRADAEFGGQGRQGVQGRRRMVVAVGEVPLDLLGRLSRPRSRHQPDRAACGSRGAGWAGTSPSFIAEMARRYCTWHEKVRSI